MKKIFLILPILIYSTFISIAQKDSIPYTKDYEFNEGVYATIKNFKQNNPINKVVVVTTIPKSQLDFYKQLVESRVIAYKDSTGNEQQIESSTLWGYCQNRSIYVNFNSSFQRLNVIGSLCYFTASVKSVMSYNDPTNYGMSNTHTELRQYVLNTQTNEIVDFTAQTMEAILINDKPLYDEFMKFKKKDKPKQIFVYLRKYNDRHLLYLKSNDKK
ncbi:MAG: hypothetical protein ABI315_11615 [Bacteroidia bacterium]